MWGQDLMATSQEGLAQSRRSGKRWRPTDAEGQGDGLTHPDDDSSLQLNPELPRGTRTNREPRSYAWGCLWWQSETGSSEFKEGVCCWCVLCAFGDCECCCNNKGPQSRLLEQLELVFSQFGGQKSKVKVLAGLVPSEASLSACGWPPSPCLPSACLCPNFPFL